MAIANSSFVCDKLLNQYQLSPIVITITPKKANKTWQEFEQAKRMCRDASIFYSTNVLLEIFDVM
jgi:hypothetical protein